MKRFLIGLVCLMALVVGCAHRSARYDCRKQAIEYCQANKGEHNYFQNCVWEKYIKCLDNQGLLFEK
jgi:hypothetical protein